MSHPTTPPSQLSDPSATHTPSMDPNPELTIAARTAPTLNSTASSDTSAVSTARMSPKPLSERKIKRYLNKNLLSLPDDILNQIASYLIPLPPQTPPIVTSLKHALSLSLTCQKFHNIVTSRLHTLDFIAPSSYTSLTCRTPHHVSAQLERFIKSVSKHLQDLRLPQGYVPSDDKYTVIGNCKNLTHLSLPVSKLLKAEQAQYFFSKFHNLQSITLDLPLPSILMGLCNASVKLKKVFFSKLPARDASFTSLSVFLTAKGPSLTSLSINLLCEDTKGLHHITRNLHEWNRYLLPSNRALPRLSAILTRHVENNGFPVLQELDVSTISDGSGSGTTYFGDMYHLYGRITLFKQAIKRIRLQNSQPKGLKKLKMRVQAGCRHLCIAFMSNWIDPQVDVEVSFPDSKLIFPRDSSEGTVVAKVKEITVSTGAYSLSRVPTDVKFEIETLGIWNNRSANAINPPLPKLISIIRMVQGESAQTLRIGYIVAGTASQGLVKLLGFTSQILPQLTVLELPAEVAFFAASPDAGSIPSNDSIKILRIYGFRDPELTMLGETGIAWRYAVRRIRLGSIEEKASWFLKCLPAFLRLLRKKFSNLEHLYMEQICVEPFVVVSRDLFSAILAIDRYEKASGVDASILRTEIMAWRRDQQ